MSPDILRVLYIGPVDRCDSIRNGFLQGDRCRLTVVTSYLGLFDLPRREGFELAIIQQTSSLREFVDSGAFIRRTWPSAKILVICANAEVLDDPLYDDWVPPNHSPDALFTTIDRLICHGTRTRAGTLSYRQFPGTAQVGNGRHLLTRNAFATARSGCARV